jgi:hypothetical protein
MLLPPGRVRIDVDLVSTAINAAVIAAVGILLGRQAKGRFENDLRLARIEAKLESHDSRFDAIDARLGSFERSLDGLRSDLTRVALAVGAGPAAEAGGAG